MIKITLFFLCVAQSAHAKSLFTTVEAGADAAGCSLGYEPITSTWQNCEQAAKWHGVDVKDIAFVNSVSTTSVPGLFLPPGCYLQFKHNNVEGYLQFCRLVKGALPRGRYTAFFSLVQLTTASNCFIIIGFAI